MSIKELSRNQIHERLMICTYQFIFYARLDDKQDINTIINSTFLNSSSKNDPFVKEYIISLIKNYNNIIDLIKPYLKSTWTFERLHLLEQAILILGVNEIKYLNTPKPVMINICVKLAKDYLDDNAYKFINGILENF